MSDPPGIACYVHTPFCAIKCDYCNFFSNVRRTGEDAVYFDGLAAEIEHHRRRGRIDGAVFDTLYLGGGTPTAFTADELRRLVGMLRTALTFAPDTEVTSEANPESLTADSAALLGDLGFNRLSIGAQSFHDDELAALSRPHDAAAIGAAVSAARGAGFTNISLDLIYGLPGQSLERWQASVERALDLGPEHLSCYCLILEPGTPLTRDVDSGRRPRPDDDLERDMFDWLTERLSRAGYDMYELSNFAKPGCRSAHNLRYWTGAPYLGFGPSAHSYLDHRRGANPAHLETYRNRFLAGEDWDPFRKVDPRDLVFERVFMGLRLTEGLNLADFEAEFGPLETHYPGLVQRLTSQGWLETEGHHLRLTPPARFLSDGIFSEFAP